MKKITALFITALMCVSFFSACASKPVTEGDEAEAPEYEEFYTYDCVIATSNNDQNPFGYKLSTVLADEAMARVKEIAERHDCDVSVSYYNTPESISLAVNTSAATLACICDIVYIDSWVARPLVAAGAFIPVEDLSEYLDSSNHEKWGALNVQEMCMVDGVLYGLVPSLWPQKLVGSDYYIVANLGITENFGIPDLREAVENLTWSRDMLTEVVTTCNDLNLATPVYGMCATPKHLIRASLLANSCNMIVEENGELVCGWQTPAALEALTWVKGFMQDNITYFHHNNGTSIDLGNLGDWGFTKLFDNGESSLLITSLSAILTDISYNVDAFAVLPFPIGPYGINGEWSGYYENCQSVFVPTFANESSYAAQVVDELFEPFASAPTYDDILQYYRVNVFHDDRDLDVILKQSESAQYSYWTDGGDEMLNAIVLSFFSKTPQQLIEENLSKLETVIEEDIMPNYLAIKELEAAGK